MGLRIWHQSFTVLGDLPEYRELLRARINSVVRPDTEVVLHGQIPGTFSSDYPGTDLKYQFLYWMHGLQWVAAAREAERQGYDGMVMANVPSPMIAEIRSLVDIPVVGYGEAAFHIAGLYGRKVAAGEWRDYAMDFPPQKAVFSIYRRASEAPLYRVEKDPANARKQGAYCVIAATGLILRRGNDLARVLSVLDKAVRLVKP